MLTGCFIPHKLLNRQTFSAFALDWFTFGNAYLELPRNRLGGPLPFKHSLAKYTRRGSTDLDQYWFIRRWKEEHTFKSGTVCHVLNPDINQEVYGMPEYMAALLAASLAHSADMFRKLYYDNGSHAGCIVYIGAGQVDDKSMKAVKETLTGARGKGAFKICCCMRQAAAKTAYKSSPSSRSRRKMSLSTLRTPHVTTYSQRTVSRRS